MDKNSLTDLLKSKDVVLQKHGKELDFLRLALERINDRDFEGLNQLASQNTISLDPLGRVLEGGTVEYIKSSLILRCYEYMVLESIFSGRAESDNLLDLCGAALLDDSSIRELHLLMSSVPFADKQVSRLKDMIEEQGLNNLQDYIWDKGLEEFFNERCRKIGQEASERLSVQEVTEKVSLQEIFEEAQLAESFVYKDIKNSRAKGQVETDLVLEAGSRNRMEALINKLYSWFESYPGDFSQLKLVLEELHMERQVKTIELKGIEAFRKYLSDSWAVGALKVAHRFGFSWPGSSSEDKQASLSKVNASFLKQAKKSSRGKAFLLWEGILHSVRKFYAAKAFIFPGRYVLVQFQPADDESHFLFGQYISQDEQKAFIMRCLAEFYRYSDQRMAAQAIIKHYLAVFSGSIRLKNIFKICLITLPVVGMVGAMVGGIYSYFMGELYEGVLIGTVLAIMGELIAAINGYKKKITPDNHESIPVYVTHMRGSIKINPVAIELDQV